MPQVTLIAAVGVGGQLGLNGKLPWHDSDDLAFFKRTTMGSVVVVGYNTAKTLPKLPGRKIHVMQREQSPHFVKSLYKDEAEIFIAGGARTYAMWMGTGLVERSIISHIPYAGEADTFMPSLWNDHLPALYENVMIVDFLQGEAKKAVAVGNTHSARFYGTLAQHIIAVRHRKWPWSNKQ